MTTNNQMKILALGEPLMELSAQQKGPLAGVGTFTSGYGGDASNFAVAAARSGGHAGMLTVLGQDEFGQAFMDLWAREGVDSSLVMRSSEAHTGLYIITRPNGSHEFTYFREGSAASRMIPDMLPKKAIEDARVLHVTGVTQGISLTSCDTAFAAMDTAKKAGTLISYDPNYRPTLWPEGRAKAVIHESIGRADIVFPSMEEAEALLGVADPERAADIYLDMGASIVALKLGAQGALIATNQGMERVPTLKVAPVDCSGAGDTFAGAFVTMYLEGKPLKDCARFAAVAAALSTTGLGCVAPIPVRDDVMKYLDGDEA